MLTHPCLVSSQRPRLDGSYGPRCEPDVDADGWCRRTGRRVRAGCNQVCGSNTLAQAMQKLTRGPHSRPDLIDPALLRPGRLDKSLLCPMPSAQDRFEVSFSTLRFCSIKRSMTGIRPGSRQILQLITRNLHLSPLVSLSDLAAETEHFTGADLGGLVGTAHLAAVHATFESATEDGSSTGNTLRTTSDLSSEEVLVIGGGSGGRTRRSRAEEAELRKRVGVMMGSGQGEFAGSARESAQDTREASVSRSGPSLLSVTCTNALLRFQPSGYDHPSSSHLDRPSIGSAFRSREGAREAPAHLQLLCRRAINKWSRRWRGGRHSCGKSKQSGMMLMTCSKVLCDVGKKCSRGRTATARKD